MSASLHRPGALIELVAGMVLALLACAFGLAIESGDYWTAGFLWGVFSVLAIAVAVAV